MRRFLCGPCRIKESRRSVLPRTSSLISWKRKRTCTCIIDRWMQYSLSGNNRFLLKTKTNLWIFEFCGNWSHAMWYSRFEFRFGIGYSEVPCRFISSIHESKSKSHYDRRSVGQCVLVSSPIWGSWPDINYCVTVTVLSISGAPSDGRSGLSFDLVTWTASVQFSKFAADLRLHCISPYL
jgi:hypothetical protein